MSFYDESLTWLLYPMSDVGAIGIETLIARGGGVDIYKKVGQPDYRAVHWWGAVIVSSMTYRQETPQSVCVLGYIFTKPQERRKGFARNMFTTVNKHTHGGWTFAEAISTDSGKLFLTSLRYVV